VFNGCYSPICLFRAYNLYGRVNFYHVHRNRALLKTECEWLYTELSLFYNHFQKVLYAQTLEGCFSVQPYYFANQMGKLFPIKLVRFYPPKLNTIYNAHNN
jgi:hypothetical protein